ncbi:MAG: hypothetical protein K2J80_05760 [Oscillospiraceae bacterium]|nr:hypothetical protein [Oscillospiraceae bacterium]
MSDTNLDNLENVFYSIIGPHADKPPEQIIADKQEEIQNCGYALWGAEIRSPLEQVWELDKNARVAVLCIINNKAEDPHKKSRRANRMITPEGKLEIPDGINTTFSSEGKGEYKAYKVKKIEILDAPLTFDFGKFEAYTRSRNRWESFAERFNQKQFQNVYGRRNDKLTESYLKKGIKVILELEYPFAVHITNFVADMKENEQNKETT